MLTSVNVTPRNSFRFVLHAFTYLLTYLLAISHSRFAVSWSSPRADPGLVNGGQWGGVWGGGAPSPTGMGLGGAVPLSRIFFEFLSRNGAYFVHSANDRGHAPRPLDPSLHSSSWTSTFERRFSCQPLRIQCALMTSLTRDFWPQSTFDLCTGAVHVSRPEAEPGAVWRLTTTRSSQVQTVARRHSDVMASRRHDVITSSTDCRRHSDVTATCQRLWRCLDVPTWRLHEPRSTWSVYSLIITPC